MIWLQWLALAMWSITSWFCTHCNYRRIGLDLLWLEQNYQLWRTYRVDPSLWTYLDVSYVVTLTCYRCGIIVLQEGSLNGDLVNRITVDATLFT